MRTMRSAFRIVPAVAVACLIASCGSETAPVESAPTQDLSAEISDAGGISEGYPLPDCSDTNGEPCITNGFDPAVDGFGFANWGEPGAMGATEMIALFGRKNVCARGSADECVMYPAAEQWVTQINEAMAGGHCEGMAVLSTRLFLGSNAIAQLDPNAESVFDLDPSNRKVISAIEMWFATQYLDPVVRAYRSYHKLTPTEIAAALIDGLDEGSGYTVGIYSDDGSHAVTPLGVGLVGDQVAISIYDNNYPGTVQRIMVDPDQETWTYAAGTTEPNAPTGGWEGGKGTIELTPMESRALPAPAPFSDKRTKGAGSARNQTILVTSPDPQTIAGAVLAVDGESYDLADPTVTPPPGVNVRPIRGNTLTSGSLVVDIDTKVVAGYEITATTENPSGVTVPVTMSIDSVGQPRISMQADSPSNTSGVARLSVDSSGSVVADTPAGVPALVSVANGFRGAAFELEGENSLAIDTVQDGVTLIVVFDEEGNRLGSFEVDGETEDGAVIYSEISFDPDTGEFFLTEEEARAEEVDADFLTFIDELVEEEFDEGTDDDPFTDDDLYTDDGTDDGTDDDLYTDDGTDDGTDDDPFTDDGPLSDEGRVEEAPTEDDPVLEADSDGGDGLADGEE